MQYPKFFDGIESIKLYDDLSEFLGTFEDGIIEFTYLDIVKNAGHSCPTVAGAYLMAREGLKALYKEDIPQRGKIKVEFKEDISDGVTGVIANVITHITGATNKSGFKGIANKFIRHSLMFFNSNINANIKLTNLLTNDSVEVNYNHKNIPANPLMNELMQKVLQKVAIKNEQIYFGQLWQERVQNILKNHNQVITIIQ